MDYMKFVEVLIPVIMVLLGAYLTYLYAVKRLQQESKESVERKKYEELLNAHRAIYSLLRYATNKENADTILVMESPQGGTKDDYVWFFRKENARKFLEELPRLFYTEGNGLFLSPEVSKPLFEYRGIVYKLYLRAGSDGVERMKIENKEMVGRMVSLHQELSLKIRDAIGLKERFLPKKS